MKTIVSFVGIVVMLAGQFVTAQQSVMDPATTSETFVVGSLDKEGGDFIVAGTRTEFAENAYIGRLSGAGMLWSKRIDQSSRITATTKTPNGEYVSVGSCDNDFLAVRFDPSGNVVWAKTFGTDTTESLRGVTCDNQGNIFTVGIKGTNSNNRNEILVKMDPSGNIVFTKQIHHTYLVGSYADKVFVRNDSVFVFGTSWGIGVGGPGTSRDPFCAVFNRNTGALLRYKVFGHYSSEWLRDVVPYQGGFLASFSSGTVICLAKLDGNLNLVSSNASMVMHANQAWVFTNALLETDGVNVFIGGQVSSTLINQWGYASYVIALDGNMNPSWAHTTAPRAFTNDLELDGQTLNVLDVQNQTAGGSFTGSIVTSLDKSFGVDPTLTYCETPQAFPASVFQYPMLENDDARTYSDVVLTRFSNKTFVGYYPLVTPCLPSPLPVELVSFVGKKDGSTSLLEWITATEIDNDYFTILRSSDKVQWSELGRVDGSGNSQTTKLYSLIDQKPLSGHNYYRLLQTDYDGGTEDHGVVHVFHEEVGGFTVFPTLVSPGQSVRVSCGGGCDIQAFDASGRAVDFSVNGDDLTLKTASRGVYTLVVTRPGVNGFETARIVLY